jgi:hypothetical protein
MTMDIRRVILVLMSLLLIVGCGASTKSSDEENAGSASRCEEPQNPYSEGSGQYAGYVWAEEKGSGECNCSSQSFNEGCEDYEAQEAKYKECESNK